MMGRARIGITIRMPKRSFGSRFEFDNPQAKASPACSGRA
jgi:Fe-S cluster assembly iron-binding protein IscA